MSAPLRDVTGKVAFITGASSGIGLGQAHVFHAAGMKVAISLALVGAIAGEFVASEDGLGHVILQAEGMFETTRVFVAITLLGVFGTALFYLVELMERLVCPWHVSHRGRARTVAGGV